MGIFDSLRPAAQEHPEFGQLEHRRGHWHGRTTLDGKSLALHLPGSRSGPDPAGLEVAARAPSWWAAVKDQVARELFEHYDAGREEGPSDLPGVSGPDDVWAHVELSSVQVKPFHSLNEIQVAIRASWDDEHTLGALLRDGGLVELNGSILEPR
jgi:hypothetical protein